MSTVAGRESDQGPVKDGLKGWEKAQGQHKRKLIRITRTVGLISSKGGQKGEQKQGTAGEVKT